MDHNTMLAFLMGQRRGGGGGSGSSVQSDWSVNDETDPAYIKNRHCYTEGTWIRAHYEEEAGFRHTPDVSDTGVTYGVHTDVENPFSSDTALKIVVDGQEYVATAEEFENASVVNLEAPAEGGLPVGIDYRFHGNAVGVYEMYVYIYDCKDPDTLEVYYEGGAIVPLPAKYIPANVPIIWDAVTGYFVMVGSVDENGKPDGWSAVDIGSYAAPKTKVARSTSTSAKTITYTAASNPMEHRYTATSGLKGLTIAADDTFGTSTVARHHITFVSGETATTLTNSLEAYFKGDDCADGVFTPVANKTYDIDIWWNSLKWVAVVTSS